MILKYMFYLAYMVCKAENKQEEYRRCFLTDVKSYDVGIPLYDD